MAGMDKLFKGSKDLQNEFGASEAIRRRETWQEWKNEAPLGCIEMKCNQWIGAGLG